MKKTFKPLQKKNFSVKPTSVDSKKVNTFSNAKSYPETFFKNINPKVIISDSIKAQIDLLHQKFDGVEWSGFLLYEISKGSIADIENLEIIVHEVFPCDVGSAAYTEYEPSDFIIDMDEATDFTGKDWNIGHIHTHHSMQAFFSGTDMSELHVNVDKYSSSFYLSLIVNEAVDYCAKVALLAENKTSSSKVTYLNNVLKNVQSSTYKTLVHYDCDIIYPKPNVSKAFLAQVDKLEESKKVVYKPAPYYNNYKPTQGIVRWTDSFPEQDDWDIDWEDEKPIKKVTTPTFNERYEFLEDLIEDVLTELGFDLNSRAYNYKYLFIVNTIKNLGIHSNTELSKEFIKVFNDKFIQNYFESSIKIDFEELLNCYIQGFDLFIQPAAIFLVSVFENTIKNSTNGK